MKAVLVYWSPITRVVVPDDATEKEIIESAQSNLQHLLDRCLHENVEKIVPDTECPYDTEFDKE